MLTKLKHLVINIINAFRDYTIQLQSATLTYYTLLALVPIIALLIVIAENFHIRSLVEQTITSFLKDQKEIASYLISFATNAAAQVNKTAFKIVGVVLLIWASLKMLIYIDVGINQLGETESKPKFIKRKLRFLVILAVICLLFFMTTGLSFYFSGALATLEKQEAFKDLAHWIILISNILPSILTIFLLSFLYFYVPYQKIPFSSALIASIITSISYQIFQALYFVLQISVSKFNAIYGTFAAFPLFLVWVHFSWMIFFVGAKLCFALANQKH